ncbi:hypothetical protein [Flavobacterium nitratireducens]|uniref:hypothetical protein n=1 Tax=Flavobacterium nitratireducens TaxID=992289 RepID=UPI002414ED04|nr:hypothetical protein [Flavobacterium nitratireducens]
MSNLNQTQKKFLNTITNIENRKKLEKEFLKANKEIAGLTEDQLYCIDNTVYTESARKKLINIFRKENLISNLKDSLN